MKIAYLEIVTPDVEAVCSSLEAMHGVSFGDPVATLGGARTVDLDGGGRVGVRAPMHETETPVVRPYLSVADAEASTAAAEAGGALVMHPPLEIPGEGTFAIFMQGGVQHAVWKD